MAIRYTDNSLTSGGIPDFIVRKHAPTILQMLLMFSALLLLSISVTMTIIDRAALVAILFIMFGAVGWYVILQLQRSRDLVLATEFQNALFASALGLNNKFCLIIRTDGNIIYLDHSFQDLFPEFLNHPRRNIYNLLEYGKVETAEREKIFNAIEHGVYDKAIFDIRGSDNHFYKIVMTIEPLMRPSGFILLRGREYIEQRATTAEAPSPTVSTLFNKSTIALFSHVMDTMNMGVYMTGPAGNIVYANSVLEQWLGFQEGEITSTNLSLQDIIYQSNNRTDGIEPNDYEGEVTMLHKTGSTMKAFINQKVIHNEQNKALGCTTLVHNMAVQSPDEKKKLW